MTEPEAQVPSSPQAAGLSGATGGGPYGAGGRVVAGTYVLRIGSPHGAVATALASSEQPQPQLVEPPLNLHPISLVGTLGREAEIGTGAETLGARRPFEVHGPAGSGRTTLLVDLLARIPGEEHGDRVVYVSARGQTVADLLQTLFESFYRCDVPFKPTDAQLLRWLGTVDALVALDDVDLSREELQQLLVEAPHCTFVLATGQPILWDGRSLALGGLPEEAATALLERALRRDAERILPRPAVGDRPPEGLRTVARQPEGPQGPQGPQGIEDREAALEICRRLGGHPLSLVQAAGDAREGGLTLEDLAALLGPSPDGGARDPAVGRIEQLTEPQRSAMALLAAVGGGPLGTELVHSCTEIEDAGAVLRSLRTRGLVHTDGASWTLAGAVTPTIADALGAEAWQPLVVEHLVAWAARSPQPEQVAEERAAILAALGWAERSGRWGDVLRVTRAVEGPLALARTWGLWRSALEAALSAARESGNRQAEAWALHQLGTRALCLDDLPEARRRLSEALRIRESLGDDEAARVTRGNARLLDLPQSSSFQTAPAPGPPAAPGRRPRSLLRAGIAAAVLAGLGWAAWWAWQPADPRKILVLDRASVPFADQPVGTVSEPMHVKVTNRGAGRLPIDGIALVGTDERDFVAQEHGCTGAPLDPDETCTVEVRFTPRAVGGRTATAVVVSRGSEVSSVALLGTGTPAAALAR